MQLIGIIGLGRMGSQMSSHLLESGFDVIGFDVRSEPLEQLEDAGGQRAGSAKEVAQEASILLTSLPTPAVVEDAFCDEDGILAGSSSGLTVLEMSTSSPDTTRAIAEVASEQGVQVIDAPVSGGPEGARSGTMTIMLGAKESELDSISSAVLNALSKQVYYLDDVGSGHMTKLVNNIMSNANRVVAMEAMALGAEYGVKLEKLFEVISNSSGSSNQFEKRMPRVLNRNFEPGFSVDGAKGDVRVGLDAADQIDYPMPLTSFVHEKLKEASKRGYGKEDAGAVVKVFESNTESLVEASAEMDESFEGY